MAKGEKQQNKGAEEKDEDGNVKKPAKLMIEFEGLTFDVRDFLRFKRFSRQNTGNSNGLEFLLTLHMSSFPYEENFIYPTFAIRERAYELLRMKLEDARVQFEVAKPIEHNIEEIEAVEEEDDLFSGLEGFLNNE